MPTIFHLRFCVVFLSTFCLFATNLAPLEAARSSDAEKAKKEAWIDANFAPNAIPPFSFVYDGVSSDKFLSSWERSETSEVQEGRTTRKILYREPNGRLEVECNLIDYADWSTLEWSLVLRNLSDGETPILESIRSLDAPFQSSPEGGAFKTILHRAVGSPCAVDDYMPRETELPPLFSCAFQPGGGRSSNLHMPYFNLQSGQNFGWIVAIGWGGEWRAEFEQNAGLGDDGLTRVRAGQATTRFKLTPREEVAAPSIVLLPWERATWIEAQNLWRAWSIDQSLPKIDGEVDRGHLWASTDRVDVPAFTPGAQFRIETIQKYLDEGIKPDYFHIDAGWYPCDGNWPKIGTWEPDKTRYPNGICEVFDYAKERGVGSVLWMEPERVAPGTWITIDRPEWVSNGENGGLFKYHNPDAFAWMLEKIDKTINEQRVDFYRQDFNMDPLPHWQAQDEPDRQGIAENKHVVAYYKLWRELRARHPHIKLDACASGGRRNDYLTMRYAVPLCRSDYCGSSLGRQIQSYGAHLWIPFTGSGYGASTTEPNFDYNFRSWAFAPYSGSAIRIADDEKYEKLRDNIAIWRQYVKPFFDDDYYPLTPCSLSEKDWIGWQYHDSQENAGVALMFRRLESEQTEGRYPLFGLDPDATYQILDVDSGATTDYSGAELLTTGLLVQTTEKPQAKVLAYRKIDK